MKKTLLLFFFFTLVLLSKSQTFKLNANESTEQFIKRTQGISNFNIEEFSGILKNSQKPIIYRTGETDEGDYVLFMLMPVSENEYKKIMIDTLFTGGGQLPKKIISILIKNIDKDDDDELIILTSAQPHSPRNSSSELIGTFYDVFVYDNINSSKLKLKNITKKFPEFTEQEDGYWIDHSTGKKKTKTIAEFKEINVINQYLDGIKEQLSKVRNPALSVGNKDFYSFAVSVINNWEKGFKVSKILDKTTEQQRYKIENITSDTKFYCDVTSKELYLYEYSIEDITVAEVEKQLKEMKATYSKDEDIWFIEPCFRCSFKAIPKTNKIKFIYTYFCGD